METEWASGYKLTIEHYPGRKKPVMVLGKDGEYLGHAVFKDEDSREAFIEFFKWLWRAK